jgi:hypothetical protein
MREAYLTAPRPPWHASSNPPHGRLGDNTRTHRGSGDTPKLSSEDCRKVDRYFISEQGADSIGFSNFILQGVFG